MNLFYALIPVTLVTVLVIVPLVVIVWLWVTGQRRKAATAGYVSLGDYLRAPPVSDREKQDSVNMALQGVVLCVLALLVPPILILGIFPLYYGLRKVAYGLMGLGLADDSGP